MTKTRTCSECNAPLPKDVPGPFCPACALRLALEKHLLQPLDQNVTPEQQFDRQWVATVLERARERLRQECIASGKSELYKLLDRDQEKSATYAEIAAQLGMSVSAIKSAVSRLRARYAELVREEIAPTVSSPAELDAEIAYLLSIIGS